MFDLINKSVMMGIGVLSMTKDKIEEIAKSVVNDSKMTEEEGKKFINDIIDKSEEAKKDFEKNVNEK